VLRSSATKRGSNKFACLDPEFSSPKEKLSSTSSQSSGKGYLLYKPKLIITTSAPVIKNASKKIKLNSVSSKNNDMTFRDGFSVGISNIDLAN